MKSMTFTLLRWLAIGYGVYLALCLLVLLPALNVFAPRLVQEHLNRELRSEIILFNPFTLALQVRGASIHEEDAHQPLALKSLEVNLSLASLWQTGIVLDAFLIDELDIHVFRRADGEFHFADLVSPGTDDPVADSSAPLPGITIHEVAINAHTLRFTDATRPGPYTTVQSDFGLKTRNLTTVPDRQGTGALELTGDGGGVLRWTGDLNIAAGESRGVLTLENIDLTHAWRYNADLLSFVTESARLDVTLNYRASWSGVPQVSLKDSGLRLHALAIRPGDAAALPDTQVILDELRIDDITLDLLEEKLAIAAVTLRGLNLAGYDQGDEISLLRMLALRDEASATPSQVASDAVGANENPADAAASTWQLSLEKFALTESQVNWRTPHLSPARIEVSPLDLRVEEIRWPANDASPFTLSLGVNGDVDLRIDGAAHIGTGDGQAQVNLAGLPLAWLNPLVNAQARTDLSRGTLALETNLVFGDFAPATVTAGLRILDFATVLHATNQEAFSLAEFVVDDARVDLDAQSVKIAKVTLQRPRGSLHILEDGTININGIVRSGPDSADAETGDSAADTVKSSGDDATANTGDESASATDATPWRVALTHFSLREGQLDFADDSLPLPFKTLIGDIEADIRDLDTASETPLTLEFAGSVDGYAPVRITGSGRPLAQQRDGELRLDFRGMDIATMSPYSGTYAGYSIDSGTLSVTVRYALDGQALDGDNRIVISQMKLGDPVESELAIDVPLKLGIALLTDSKGVIDLSVPVSGDVNDPSFSLGSIIGTAIKNIIVKAVTAPFSLLAGLIGSDADLEHIAFAAGKSSPDVIAKGALGDLAEALKQRPKLTLLINGGSDPALDGQALRAAALEASLIADGLPPESLASRDAAFMALLEARYSALPAPEATPETAPADGESPASGAPSLDAQWTALINATPLPASALQTLATERAASAKRELVTVGGIDAERITISYDAKLNQATAEMAIGS